MVLKKLKQLALMLGLVSSFVLLTGCNNRKTETATEEVKATEATEEKKAEEAAEKGSEEDALAKAIESAEGASSEAEQPEAAAPSATGPAPTLTPGMPGAEEAKV